MKPHILVVEDEKHLGVGIKYNLEAENYRVTLVEDGPSALQAVISDSNEIDLVVLALMLPGMSGYTVCESIREAGLNTPGKGKLDKSRSGRSSPTTLGGHRQ